MSSKPLVSVVIIFLDAEKYLQEAIESVINQTYRHWELLLVDDGSTDAGTEIARRYAAQRPGQVRYLEHRGRANRGMSASRNLGIRNAKGSYIALLDADDVWLPHKLEEQVSILERYPEAGMLYGKTQYWYSWQQGAKDTQRDFVPALGVPANTLLAPPRLLPLYLSGDAAVPCTCSVLLRTATVTKVGGFAEEFKGLYEDQAFYAKVTLQSAVLAVDTCWDKYRQHPQSSMAATRGAEKEIKARRYFLKWLERYLLQEDIRNSEVWRALQRAQWRIQDPAWLPPNRLLRIGTRWVKKWLLHLEENTLPGFIGRRLWRRVGGSR
jgi:glycosyltransferase involved in cell wall biosynthesis